MEIKTNTINNIQVIEISGSFDIYTAGPVRSWLEQSTRESPANIILDLSKVNFIDSTALAILIKSIRDAKEKDGDIRLCGLQQPVRMVLELTRLDKVFEIFPTREEALLGFTN
jgi:anti-sigma B factor antagonist